MAVDSEINYKEKTFSSIKQTCGAIGRNVSEKAERMADICVDDSVTSAKKKWRGIKNETVSLLKDIACDTRENLSGITLKGIMCDTSYVIGRAAKKTFKTTKGLFRNIMG